LEVIEHEFRVQGTEYRVQGTGYDGLTQTPPIIDEFVFYDLQNV